MQYSITLLLLASLSLLSAADSTSPEATTSPAGMSVSTSASARAICPDGSWPVQCFVNPCNSATCPGRPNAVCRPNYCGGCNAEFFNPAGVKVSCRQCPQVKCVPCASGNYAKDANGCQTCRCLPATPTPKPTVNPGTCPDGSRPVQCFVNPCQTATCPAFPNAQCRANYCGGCNADFYNAGVKVDCVRGMPSDCPVLRCMACPAGQSYIKDARGCDTCTCAPNNAVTTRRPQATPKPTCGPVCAIACQYGNVLDANDCPTCQCKPAPTQKPTCGPVCAIFCEHGNVLDDKGCPTCRCKPAPSTTPKPICGPVCAIFCPNGNVLDENGCPTCRCKPAPPTIPPVCGPVCAIFCPNGNVLDENGCPTCRCKPNPTATVRPTCGPVCAIFCPNGNVLDQNGCPTCRCKPGTGLPTIRPTIGLPTIRPTISLPTVRPACGPVCAIFCPNGNVLDARGCPTCQCKPGGVSTLASAGSERSTAITAGAGAEPSVASTLPAAAGPA